MFNNGFEEHSCVNCVKKCDVFKALTESELDLMYQSRYETFYRQGEVIAKQGTPISHLISISEGLVKIVLETSGEPDIILSIEKPVLLVTGPGVFVDNRYHFSVIALTPINACYIDVQYLHRFIETNSEFAKRFYRNVGESAINLYNRIRSLNQKNMGGRISEAILYLHHRIFETNPFELPLTRQELAEFTGMTKESVSRILKEFKEEGILDVDDHTVHILNMDRLENIARKG